MGGLFVFDLLGTRIAGEGVRLSNALQFRSNLHANVQLFFSFNLPNQLYALDTHKIEE